MVLPTGICVAYFFFKPTPAILSLVGTAALHDKSGKSKPSKRESITPVSTSILTPKDLMY
tara:strand:+ start:152 stop:331 length:180 start_codon:yes stop_codon:yes gene_type:complete